MKTIEEIFSSKDLKPKEKVSALAKLLLNQQISSDDLISFGRSAKEVVKASCIEAMENSSQKNTELISKKALVFCIQSLSDKAPRIKWESARVISNVIHRFPEKAEEALGQLLNNTEHEGTVVRWSAATAIGKIILLKLPLNKSLLPGIETILENEEKNSIKKIYLTALKKVK